MCFHIDTYIFYRYIIHIYVLIDTSALIFTETHTNKYRVYPSNTLCCSLCTLLRPTSAPDHVPLRLPKIPYVQCSCSITTQVMQKPIMSFLIFHDWNQLPREDVDSPSLESWQMFILGGISDRMDPAAVWVFRGSCRLRNSIFCTVPCICSHLFFRELVKKRESNFLTRR